MQYLICCIFLSLNLILGHSLYHGTNWRIIGGDNSDIIGFPYIVSVRNENGHTCGGSLVKPNLVITAAHCTYRWNKSLEIRAGSSYLNSGGQLLDVRKIHRHPNFNLHVKDFDVALLELSSAVTTPEASSIQLPDDDTFYQEGDFASIAGWGRTLNKTYSEVLQTAQVNILPKVWCTFSVYKSQTNFCGGLLTGGKDTCYGDSGGPLVINNILIGITSHGAFCGSPFYPGVYTEVKKVMDFVNEVKDKVERNKSNEYKIISYKLYLILYLIIKFYVL